MFRYQDVVQTTNGAKVSGATVAVYTTGTTTLAPLFSNNSGTALANPVTTDANGRFAFYVADGRYDLAVVSSFGSYTVTDVAVADTKGDFLPLTGGVLTGGLALSASPDAWGGGWKAVTLGASGNNVVGNTAFATGLYLTTNYYISAGGSVYANTGPAAYFGLIGNTFVWGTAPSGSAGTAATLMQTMELDANGNLLINLLAPRSTNAKLQVAGPINFQGYTVATLPAGTIGDRAYVTDASGPTFLGVLTGGGATRCPAFHNGSAWVAG